MFDAMKRMVADVMRRKRFDRLDFIVLKTSLMLAATDGEISRDEIDRFKELAERCRGYSAENFDALWNEAVQSAGYLLLQSRFLGKDELVAVFVKDAERDFVGEVALERAEDRVRAVEFLDRMAMADGDYSEIERACIAALVKQVRKTRAESLDQRYPHAAKFDRR